LEAEAPRVLVLAEAEDLRTVRDLLDAPDASDRHVQRASRTEAARRAAGEEACDAALILVPTAPEIRETLADRPMAESALRRLRERHVLLHMDDFGTGYCSLSHLVHARVHTLKIDAAFVRNRPARGESFEIVRMAVSLAHNLGMSVVAEGVETQAQCDELRPLRCEFAQGFLFFEPLDAEAAEAYIARSGAP